MYNRAQKWAFTVTCAAALAVRLGYVALGGLTEWQAWPDSRHYDRIGWRLAQGEGYDDPSESPPAVWRPPLLPLFLGAVYRVAGHSPLVAQVAQALLGTAGVALLILAARRLFGPGAAMLAGLAGALYPAFVYLPSVFYPESLGVPLMSLCAFLVAVSTDKRAQPWLRWGALGLVLGVGALCRANWLVSLPLLIPGVIVVRYARGYGVTKLGGVIAGAGWMLAWAPWAIRNYVTYGAWISITCGGGGNFYLGNNLHASWNSKTDVPKPELLQDLRSDNPKELDNRLYALGWQYASSHPGRTVYLWLGKLVNYWQPVPRARDHDVAGFKVWVATVASASVLVGGIAGGLSAARRRDWRVLLLLAIPVVDSAISAAFITPSRLRIPFDSMWILVGAGWLAGLRRRPRPS